MKSDPEGCNPNAIRMKQTFDFESRPGLALVRPEIAKQLSAACKPPVDAPPALTYHPDDEEEDGWTEPTWFLEWPMWQFLLLSVLCLSGVWQLGEWACDLWQWAKFELVKGGLL